MYLHHMGWTVPCSNPCGDRYFFSPYCWFKTWCTANPASPVHWIPGLCPRVKWRGYEGNHSHPSSRTVKNDWSYASILPNACMPWAGQTLLNVGNVKGCRESKTGYRVTNYWSAHDTVGYSNIFMRHNVKMFVELRQGQLWSRSWPDIATFIM
jgi:hypothetical protein